MILLAPSDYARALPLFAGYDALRAAVWTVFEERQAGGVYVDDAATPRAAAVWSQDCYLGGQPDVAFASQAADLVRHLGVARRRYVYVYATDPRWLDLMSPLLAVAGADGAVRKLCSVFHFDAAQWASRHTAWRARVPADCIVAPLDAHLADYPNIVTLWGSVEHFLAEGLGYAVLHNGERVTKAQAVFLGGGRVEIGLDTLPAYQRRGYGRLAACACIEHALAVGLTPEWGAFDNPPSVALAMDLGFVPEPDWPVLYLRGQGAG